MASALTAAPRQRSPQAADAASSPVPQPPQPQPPASCPHVRRYLSDHVVTIRNYAVASLKPYTKIAAPRCFDCQAFCHRLHACLDCIFIGCFKNKHIHQHARAQRHSVAIDLRRLELYCFVCCDAVYDDTVDAAIAKGTKVVGLPQQQQRVTATPSPASETAAASGDAGRELKVGSAQALAKWHFRVVEDKTGLLGLRGMVNLGNTCFMNVVLQAMVNNTLLRNFFLSDGHNRHLCNNTQSPSGSKVCLSCNMDQVFEKAFSGDTTPYAPHEFLCSMWTHADHLAGYEQQDAHEFAVALLDGIHSSCGGTAHDCRCIIHSAFAGELQSNVTCTQCSSVSTAVDPIFDIALDLNNTASSIPQTLFDCLERFTHPERLADKFFCRKCQSPQESMKQFLIRTLPPVLCFHIKRFKHHGHVAKPSSKVGSYVQFPIDDLDISRFTAASSQEPDAARAACRHGSLPGRQHLYNLFAVVEHAGSLDNGHYIAYVRRALQWFKCDDAMVREASEREVIQSQCYMLFYIRSS